MDKYIDNVIGVCMAAMLATATIVFVIFGLNIVGLLSGGC